MKQNLVKVEDDKSLSKDLSSSAVISNDSTAFHAAKKEHERAMKIIELEKRIKLLEEIVSTYLENHHGH